MAVDECPVACDVHAPTVPATASATPRASTLFAFSVPLIKTGPSFPCAESPSRTSLVYRDFSLIRTLVSAGGSN